MIMQKIPLFLIGILLSSSILSAPAPTAPATQAKPAIARSTTLTLEQFKQQFNQVTQTGKLSGYRLGTTQVKQVDNGYSAVTSLGKNGLILIRLKGQTDTATVIGINVSLIMRTETDEQNAQPLFTAIAAIVDPKTTGITREAAVRSLYTQAQKTPAKLFTRELDGMTYATKNNMSQTGEGKFPVRSFMLIPKAR